MKQEAERFHYEGSTLTDDLVFCPKHNSWFYYQCDKCLRISDLFWDILVPFLVCGIGILSIYFFWKIMLCLLGFVSRVSFFL